MKKITILGVLLSIICLAGMSYAGIDAINVNVDIKPMSCPNPFNAGSTGVLPVAILGTADFDVNEIDPASILLAGVSPLRWYHEDVATADAYRNTIPECPCSEEGPDGFMDLTLKFDSQEVGAAIGNSLYSGEIIELNLTGSLLDGYLIHGYDCMIYVAGEMFGGVTLCHRGMETITAGAGAVPAHLRHGDTLGPCPE